MTAREKIILKRCSYCNRLTNTVDNRRINTAYEDEESNWMASCKECYEDAQQHYADAWSTYYSSRF